jgi:hypothetical protein
MKLNARTIGATTRCIKNREKTSSTQAIAQHVGIKDQMAAIWFH